MKIGFTGTKDGMTPEQKKTITDFIENNYISEFHHGDCIGSDEDFHNICSNNGIDNIIIHPPIFDKHRAFCKSKTILEEKPYLKRNKDIVNSSDILLATPNSTNEILRSGTWSTIRYGIKNNIKVIIVYPNGISELK